MRRVFFSFHFARDAWSVGQIRNSWVANAYRDAQPILDKAQWEQVKRRGDRSIQNWIDRQMDGTSVTAVLIGPQTLSRKWVRYEVDRSTRNGKGIIGITMENMIQSNRTADAWTQYATYGPFAGPLKSVPIYSWINDNGRQNLGHWVESAAKKVGR